MTSLNLQTTLPKILKSQLYNSATPWQVSPDLFKRVTQQTWEAGTTPEEQPRYKKCEVLPTDPEAQFVRTYFLHEKPAGYTISKIFCLHTPAISTVFENSIEKIDQQAQIIKPEWDKEDLKPQREQVIQRWKEQTNLFYPVTVPQKDRSETFFNVRVLPLWHGTNGKVCHFIASAGFLSVGNHHFFDPNAKAGSIKKTDAGYFGNGIYFTNSARYASMYNAGHLLLTWVSMREPFPVVNDVPHPTKGKDMQMLYGKMAYQTYNTHYIPVAPISDSPSCMEYYPCYQHQTPTCDEIVVFKDDQTLPRFWVELTVDFFPHSLSSSTVASGVGTIPASSPSSSSSATTTLSVSHTTTTTTSLPTAPSGSASPPVPKKSSSPATSSGSTSKNSQPVELNLWTACEIGDLAFVQATIKSWWIKHEEKINKPTKYGDTPLVLAVKKGHFEVVEFLLGNEASVHIPDIDGYFPLHWAAKIGHIQLVQLLVKKGALVNSQGLYQRTPLHMAAHNGKTPVVAWLLSTGASVNAQASYEDNLATPLHEAVMRGHLGVVQTLTAHTGLDVNLVDSNQHTALYYAVLSGEVEMMQLITRHPSWSNPSHSSHPNHISQLLKLFPVKNKAAIQAYLEALGKKQ